MPERRASAPRALVLVVDDAQDIRELYAELLALAGLRTSMAADGIEALRKAEEEQPDIIVLDITLPKMDGWEVTRQLKANPKTKHIRVIALSGRAESEDIALSKQFGCDSFIAKPCLPERLLREVLEFAKSG